MQIDIPDETESRIYHIRYEVSSGEIETGKRYVVYLPSGFDPDAKLRSAFVSKLEGVTQLSEIDFTNELNDTRNYTREGMLVQDVMSFEHKEKRAKALVTQYLSSLGLETVHVQTERGETTLTTLINQQRVMSLNQSAWASESAAQGRPQAAEGITTPDPRGRRAVLINEENHTLNAIVHELFHAIKSYALTNLPGSVVDGMTEYFTLQAAGLDFRLARDATPVHADSVRALRLALTREGVTQEQLVQGYFLGQMDVLDRLRPAVTWKTALRDFHGKTVNFVWIGVNPVNALGAFNAASWLLCGWNVNVFRHIPPGAPQGPTFPESLDAAVRQAARVGNASLCTIPLSEAVMGEAGRVMPQTAQVIIPWLKAELRGHLPYVLGDISKAFIAGTHPGIVLDTKIGPSPWVHHYPADPFEKFICASRAGGNVIENQCMGSFALNSSRKYASVYDPKPGNFFKGVNLESVKEPQSIFGGLTSMHSAAYTALAKSAALDITTFNVPWPGPPYVVPPSVKHDKETYKFTELQAATWKLTFRDEADLKRFIADGRTAAGGTAGAQLNRGPFRVYQVAGYYNWSQGEYAQQKMSNDASVARTLIVEHKGKARDLPDPFKSFGDPYSIVGSMIEAVVASLSIWREDQKK
jgi:hypothetical protein